MPRKHKSNHSKSSERSYNSSRDSYTTGGGGGSRKRAKISSRHTGSKYSRASRSRSRSSRSNRYGSPRRRESDYAASSTAHHQDYNGHAQNTTNRNRSRSRLRSRSRHRFAFLLVNLHKDS
jgi:hypothetical protein